MKRSDLNVEIEYTKFGQNRSGGKGRVAWLQFANNKLSQNSKVPLARYAITVLFLNINISLILLFYIGIICALPKQIPK